MAPSREMTSASERTIERSIRAAAVAAVREGLRIAFCWPSVPVVPLRRDRGVRQSADWARGARPEDRDADEHRHRARAASPALSTTASPIIPAYFSLVHK
jgi:hypothetical protein